MGEQDINISRIIEEVSKETQTTPTDIVNNVFNNRNRIQEMLHNEQGKFRVLGIDKFDNEDWVAGEFDTPEDALGFAYRMTEAEKPFASDESVATVYYAYSPQGEYLGNMVPDPDKTEDLNPL